MNISIGARTDIGGRPNNEDCLAVLDKERVPIRADAVLVIADGMGGRANGEEASGIAVRVVRETLMELLDSVNERALPPAEDILSAAMRRANSAVYDLAQANPELPGMGTTCIAALISEGTCTLAHVGDSRAYMIRNNKISPLTVDHTYVADQVRAGNMSSESARKSRFKNVITRAIGIAPTVEPDFETVQLLDGDTLLFCTDGLSNTLDEDGILEISGKSDTAQKTAGNLLAAAKARRVRDNVTVIAVRISSDVLSSRFLREPSQSEAAYAEPQPSTNVKLEIINEPVYDETPTLPAKKDAEEHSSTGFRYVILAVVAAILGGIATAATLMELGLLSFRRNAVSIKTGQEVHAPVTPADTNLFDLQYGQPIQLYYKPLRPDILMISTKDIVVALAQSGQVIHLNDLGQLDDKPDGVNVAGASSQTAYYAADPAGDLFQSNSVTKAITETSSDGSRHRVIAQDLLDPRALAVDPDGNIYVIVGGELYTLRVASTNGKSQ
jgi:protein phosphatase